MPDTTAVVGTSSPVDLGLGGASPMERLDLVAVAIVEAVAYADVFDWPLSAGEIHRYLPVAARLDEVEAALVAPDLARWISAIDGYFVLRGREGLLDERQRKAALSARLWPQAIRYGRIVSWLPWVRLVAVTGSLAVGAAADDADIDLFIVTDDGRLWLARALTIGVAKVATRLPSTRGLRLCPNYLVTASALDLPERDLYTARELAQLVPLFGPKAYDALLERNRWFRRFLPNHPGPVDRIGDLGARRLRRVLETVLRNPVVERLERWEMERKIARLSIESTNGEVRFDRSTCKGHFEGYRRHVLDVFAERLSRLGAGDAVSRVLVGQSYYLRFDPKLWRTMQPYPPLGSLYAAADLRRRGHDVAVFDAMLARSEDEWGEALARHRPDVAVIFEDNFNYLSKMCLLRMRTAAFRMLEMARGLGCTTIVCGSDATDNAEPYLERGADFVVVGEGEVTLAELLEQQTGSPVRAPTNLRGLAFRGADGSPIATGRPVNLKDLDALAFPAWDLIDVERYRQAWARHGRFSMNMVTTRGCPFHCNWCAKPIWGQRFASRGPDNVVAELEWLRQTYSPDHISFVDDIFGLKPGWIRAYADLVRRRDTVVPFKCLSRADLLLRDGEVDALRDAGCETVWIGAESGSQQILDAMEKGTRVEQIVESSRRLRAAGIRCGFFLQFGYPGEGPEEIEATRRLVRECRPDDIGISVSYPLPGTRFYDRVRSELGERRNWVDSEDLSMLYRGPFSTDYYRRLHRVVHREFRLRQAAGTVSPATHLARAARRIGSRDRLGRARDAVVLPLDQLLLDRMQRLERRRSPAS